MTGLKYFGAWLFITLLGGHLGAEWSVKDVPSGKIGTGDGIGIVLYGTIGAFYGAIIGLVLIPAFALIKWLGERRARSAERQAS